MDELAAYLPSASFEKISFWLEKYNCKLKITAARSTKLGDYRYSKKGHEITINNDLNKYSFLITLTHEIAHMMVRDECKPGRLPHGKEWKDTFQKLMLNFLPLFPNTILEVLSPHLKNPKASTTSDVRLYKVLREYDEKKYLTVADVKNGDVFETPNGKKYLMINKVRTRYKCKSLSNNRMYLFSALAEINKSN